LLHARRHHAVPRGPASGDRRRQGLEAVRAGLDVRGPRHPLAGFRPRHAAASGRGGDPQEGRGKDCGVGCNPAERDCTDAPSAQNPNSARPPLVERSARRNRADARLRPTLRDCTDVRSPLAPCAISPQYPVCRITVARSSLAPAGSSRSTCSTATAACWSSGSTICATRCATRSAAFPSGSMPWSYCPITCTRLDPAGRRQRFSTALAAYQGRLLEIHSRR